MKRSSKLIRSIFILMAVFSINTVYANSRADSAILYYKNAKNGFVKVDTREQCDFYRIITSPVPPDTHYSVKDFYSTGELKLTGMVSERLFTGGGELALDGDCTTYFKAGGKQSIVQYKEGYKNGKESLFYPNGKLYAIIKYIPITGYSYAKGISWDCYDLNGTMICKEGNGNWLIYNNDFKSLIIEGPMKKGEKNGDWRGECLLGADSIKYIYHFKDGLFKSGESYDKAGKSYQFTQDVQPAYYWSGPFQFLRTLQGHMDLPKDSNGKKISADDVVISFIVEKDGHTTHLETLAPVIPALRESIEKALSKCKDWTPRKNYGIPVRAQIVLSLKYVTTTTTRAFQDEIFYQEKQVND
jgi:hypothetical protein